MRKYLLYFMVLQGIAITSYAEQISSLVEFFSFRCSHCANVNDSLGSYIANHQNVKFFDVNVDSNDAALPTTIMYYVATDAGVGQQFKTNYFAAVANGMPVYQQSTLNYVTKQVMTPELAKLLKSAAERERIKDKVNYANLLLSKYQIQGTPTFLINQSILLEGEAIINSLN